MKGLVAVLLGTPFVAFGQAAAEAAPSQPSFLESVIPFLLIFVLMYFLLIRPQIKKAKEHTTLLGALQPGDEIVTSGGIIGRIRSIADNFVLVDVGTTNLKILKENITRLTHSKNEPAKVVVKEKKDA